MSDNNNTVFGNGPDCGLSTVNVSLTTSTLVTQTNPTTLVCTTSSLGESTNGQQMMQQIGSRPPVLSSCPSIACEMLIN